MQLVLLALDEKLVKAIHLILRDGKIQVDGRLQRVINDAIHILQDFIHLGLVPVEGHPYDCKLHSAPPTPRS